MSTNDNKRQIGLRLEEANLQLLEKVAQLESSPFYGMSRTQLIEYAIRSVFYPIAYPAERQGEVS